MNTRQIEIVRLLLVQPKGVYLLVQRLADQVGCSEKTIRNDFKVIEEYLQSESNAALIRKPGLGVSLEIAEKEKAGLYQSLFSNNLSGNINDGDRLQGVAYCLLMSNEPIAARDLAAKFFVNKNVIKKDIEKIRAWLKQMDLTLISKQRIGLMVKGTEKNKRSALSRLSEISGDTKAPYTYLVGQFTKSEFEIVQYELTELVKHHSLHFTDDAMDNLVIQVLLQIRRIKLKQIVGISEKDSAFLIGKKEYKWAADFLKKVEIIFVLHIPESELMYFTLHLLGAKIRFPEKQAFLPEHPLLNDMVASLIEGMAETNQKFTEDLHLKKGLLVHLNTTLNRLNHGLDISNPMMPEIKKMYLYMFDRLINVLEKVNGVYNIHLPEAEAGYLTLHFQASIERQLKNAKRKKNVVIVCHMGIGMSQLLRTKLERKIPEINVTGCIGKSDLHDYLEKIEVDLIISTIDVSNIKVPHLVVSPLLSEVETEKLESFLKILDRKEEGNLTNSALSSMLNPSFMYLHHKKCHRFEIIEYLATELYKAGYVAKEYGHYAIARERMSSTAIGSSIAIPHGNPKHILKSGLALATFNEQADWETEKVSMVIMLAMREEDLERTKQLFHELSFLSEQPDLIQSLVAFKDKNQFLSYLNQLPKLLELKQS